MSLDTSAPTRMNLLARKAQIKLAVDGVSLLKGKRDALLQELIARARALRIERNELHARGRQAVIALALARALRGAAEVRSAALAGQREMNVEVKTHKVWGLNLADIDLRGIVRTPEQRGIGLLDVSAYLLEAGEAAERMLEQLLKCAPMERNLQILGEEVKKVSRRINALEEYLLPRLRHEVRTIARVLDEREREDIFRLKRIKGKKAAQKKKKAAMTSEEISHAIE
jgi:V/A-type H+-transporting ATPase subunit D